MSGNVTAKDVQDQLVAMAMLIKTANGFANDIADGDVYSGREGFSQDDTYPLVTAIYLGSTPIKSYPGTRMYLQDGEFQLSGLIKADPADPSVAPHSLLQDLKRAIYGDQAPGDLAAMVAAYEPAGEAILNRVDGALLAQATLTIRVQWRETLNP
jgi:hypothetical protein